jgi:membrane associated rhomboid family serine protease
VKLLPKEAFFVNKLNQMIDRFCFRHPRFGIPNLIYYYIGGNVLVYLLDYLSYSGVAVSELLDFNRSQILQGQVWRLFTFIFTTWGQGLFFFLLAMYFIWFIGTSLEREWGTAKFSCYYLLGWLLSMVSGLFTGYASSSYIDMTMFLAFATLFPDVQFLLFFIIPVKAKWLAWVDGGLLALSLVRSLIALDLGGALAIVVAVLNYLIFFWPELMYQARRLRGQANYSRQSNVVQFKKASRDLKRRDYTHKCAVCGRTDVDFPDLEFRYCSKCAGYHCYCADHINNHEHITE